MTEQELEQALAAMNERLLRLEYHDDKNIFKHDGVYYHVRSLGKSPFFMRQDEYEKEFAEWRQKREAS